MWQERRLAMECVDHGMRATVRPNQFVGDDAVANERFMPEPYRVVDHGDRTDVGIGAR